MKSGVRGKHLRRVIICWKVRLYQKIKLDSFKFLTSEKELLLTLLYFPSKEIQLDFFE